MPVFLFFTSTVETLHFPNVTKSFKKILYLVRLCKVWIKASTVLTNLKINLFPVPVQYKICF